MRKTINIMALLFFIWLVLDAFSIPDKLLYFLAIGALPGTTATISPTLMLAIMTGLIGVIVFESTARHFEVMRHIRRVLLGSVSRRQRLPARRFTRI